MNEQAMMNSIRECSSLFLEMLDKKTELTQSFVALFKEQPIKRIYLSGHGSPYDAAVAIKAMLNQWLKVEASVEIPTLFNNHEGFNVGHIYRPDEMLLICPAGTGKTRGPVLAAKEARRQGIKVFSSATIEDGILSRNSDVFINKLAGNEENFPDCKGHACTLFLYALCILEAARALGRMDEADVEKKLRQMRSITNHHSQVIEDTLSWFQANRELMVTAQNIRILGYGANYSTAIEGALKLSESTGIQAIGWELEQYLHGPILSLQKTDLIFCIGAQDVEQMKMKKIAALIHSSMCQNVVWIGREEQETENSLVSEFIDDPILSVLEYIVPFQVLAAKTAEALGHSVICTTEEYERIDPYLETRFDD